MSVVVEEGDQEETWTQVTTGESRQVNVITWYGIG